MAKTADTTIPLISHRRVRLRLSIRRPYNSLRSLPTSSPRRAWMTYRGRVAGPRAALAGLRWLPRWQRGRQSEFLPSWATSTKPGDWEEAPRRRFPTRPAVKSQTPPCHPPGLRSRLRAAAPTPSAKRPLFPPTSARAPETPRPDDSPGLASPVQLHASTAPNARALATSLNLAHESARHACVPTLLGQAERGDSPVPAWSRPSEACRLSPYHPRRPYRGGGPRPPALLQLPSPSATRAEEFARGPSPTSSNSRRAQPPVPTSFPHYHRTSFRESLD